MLAKPRRKLKKATLIGMELNRSLNDKNAQSFPKQGKAAAHVYMLFRAQAKKEKKKRRPKGVNHAFLFLIPGKKKKKELSSNH